MSQDEIDKVDASTRIQERTAYKMAIKALKKERRHSCQYVEMARYGLNGWGMNLRKKVANYYRYQRAIEFMENKLSALTK